jgi:carboxymethylenebutenolidase
MEGGGSLGVAYRCSTAKVPLPDQTPEMRVYLPGVAPTGRKVVLPHVVVMGFDEMAGLVAYENIYWDQATLLVQVGLLDPALLPVAGVEQAKRLMDPTQPANEMIARRLPVSPR